MPHTGQTSLLSMPRRFAAALAACLCLGFVSSASAQDKSTGSNAESLKTTTSISPSEGLSFNLPGSPDFTAQTGPQLDLPLDAVGSTMYKLDLTSPGCASGGDSCNRRTDNLKLGLTDTFRRRSEKGLDLSLTPARQCASMMRSAQQPLAP